MSEAQIVVIDDGYKTSEKIGLYDDLIADGHVAVFLPFDSGFGKKSNVGSKAFNRPYLLISSDDFDHSPASVREGVEKLVEVLDNSDVDIASGKVGQRCLVQTINEVEPGVIKLEDVSYTGDEWFVDCDLTVNYSLVKWRVFNHIGWDSSVKIGGSEHLAWFADAKKAGLKVAFVPGVSINEQEGEDSAEYKALRARANRPERECLVKRGIRKLILANGKTDYNG